MAGYQKLILQGNLVRDPEMRYTPDGTAVCNFTIAVNEPGKDSPMWMRVSVWGQQAENSAEYLEKGQTVLVEGKLKHDNGNPRQWKDRNGKIRASYEMTGYYVVFGKKANGNGGQQGQQGGGYSGPPEDQIPF